MQDGMVYRVGEPMSLRLLRQDQDSTGLIAGCPIFEAGPIGENEDWLLSFKSILAKPGHYLLHGTRTFFTPDHIVRLYGEGDTISVMTDLDRSIFWVHLATKGTAATGSLGDDVGTVKALIRDALEPVRRRNPGD